MSVYIRPQSSGEIFRNAAYLYRTNFWALFRAYLVPLTPVAVLYGAMLALEHKSQATVFTALALLFLGGLLAVVPITAVLSDICLGNQPDLGRAFRLVASRSLGKLLGTYLLSIAIVAIGFVLLLVPGIIFSLWFAFVLTIGVIERTWGWQALKRSKELGKGFYGRNFWILFLCSLLVEIVGALGGGVLGFIVAIVGLPQALIPILGAFAGLLPAPLVPIVTVLLYYDLRARKEAYDSSALAEDLRR